MGGYIQKSGSPRNAVADAALFTVRMCDFFTDSNRAGQLKTYLLLSPHHLLFFGFTLGVVLVLRTFL